MGRVRVDWHGSFAVIVTPFARDGDIDEAAYRKVVDLVIEAGCHGLISAGSTGEFFLMTDDERRRVLSIAVDQTAGRMPVLAGTSAVGTEDVIGLTRFAAEVGCAGAMVLPPIYIGVDDRELVEFYGRVSGEAGLPIMLYNSPRAVRTFLTPRLVEQLMGFDNVVAIKDSSLDLRQLNDLVRYCGHELRVFVGLETSCCRPLPWGQWESWRWCLRWLAGWRSSCTRPLSTATWNGPGNSTTSSCGSTTYSRWAAATWPSRSP